MSGRRRSRHREADVCGCAVAVIVVVVGGLDRWLLTAPSAANVT